MKPPIYYARYTQTYDFHKNVLKLIQENKYVAGEKNRILKHFTNQSDQNFILNSQYFIEVKNVELALKIALKKIYEKQQFNFKSIAITGTSGKTSTLQLTAEILKRLQNKPILQMGTMGIVIDDLEIQNSHLTTPDYSVFIKALQLAQKARVDTFVIEMTSQSLAESRIHDYEFDICIFTNFSHDHLDFHESMEKYLAAKTLLFTKKFKANGTCIICTSSPEWFLIAQQSVDTQRILYLNLAENSEKNENFSNINENILSQISQLKDKFRTIYLLEIKDKKSSFEGLAGRFVLSDSAHNIISDICFSTPIIGNLHFENLMNVFSVCHAMGYKPADFIPYLNDFKGIIGCIENLTSNVQLAKMPAVFIDSSHKVGSLQAALKTIRDLMPRSCKIITVFSCDGDNNAIKRPLMGQIAEQFSDICIVTSGNPRDEDPHVIAQQIISGMKNGKFCDFELDRKLAIQKALNLANAGDAVLIAGKGHETYQIIGKQKFQFSDKKIAQCYLDNIGQGIHI